MTEFYEIEPVVENICKYLPQPSNFRDSIISVSSKALLANYGPSERKMNCHDTVAMALRLSTITYGQTIYHLKRDVQKFNSGILQAGSVMCLGYGEKFVHSAILLSPEIAWGKDAKNGPIEIMPVSELLTKYQQRFSSENANNISQFIFPVNTILTNLVLEY